MSLLDVTTILKAKYMLFGLNPDGDSEYVRVVETSLDNKYKKGELYNRYQDEIDETVKTEPVSNKDLFMMMITNYTYEVLENLNEKYFPNIKLDDYDTLIRQNVKMLKNDTENDFVSAGKILDLSINLEEFCEYNDEVIYYLENKDKNIYEIFNNASCLILFYGIWKHQSSVIKNWLYSKEELEELLKIMNISSDVL